MMKRILSLVAAFMVASLSGLAADILAQWNFNQADAAAAAVPSSGAGTLVPVGGITTAAPTSGSGSSDPVTTGDTAYQTSGYPAADAGDRTAGIEVAVSTAGYKNVAFSFDYRGSNTSSRKLAVQYSLDGVNFTEGAIVDILTGGAFTNGITLNLSGITGANDNPLFKVRIVSAFDGISYVAISGNYSANGTARFDMVTVSGETLGGLPVAPTVFASPQSRTNLVGSTATLTVVVTGTQPLAFVWEKETAPGLWQTIAGATSASLTLANLQLTDSGNYRARVSNEQGSATSDPATLTVQEDPSNTVRTIASLKSEVDVLNNDNNVDTTALYLVEGVVTSHANLTTTAGARLFYFQDATGGIAAFWRNATIELKAGDKVRVKAPLTFFNGLLEFSPNSSTAGHEVTLLSGDNPLPTPKPFDFNLLDAANFAALEAEEGRLVVVENVSLDAGGDLAFRSKSSGYPVTPASGSTAQPFTMFVNSGTDIVNQAIPAGPFTIIGVLGQFDGSNPRDSGYQVIPTRYVDVQTASKPASIRFTNTLSNLVRPGDAVTNTFAEHALRPGESISIGFAITDPDGRPVNVTLGNAIPPGGQWNFGSTSGAQVNGMFTYTATAAAAGNAYDVSVTADNGVASFTQSVRLYVPTAAEQQVVITEFYANPAGTNNVAWFNPLNRSELLPGGTDASPANRDEFVELVNLSGETIDLTGWMLSDALLRRAYIYPGTPGTSLAPSNSVIVYGGPTIGYAPQLAVPAIAAEVGPGDAFSTAGLALNNDGDTIVLRNAASNIVARVVYTGSLTSTNSSLTRFPTDRDAFVAHRNAGALYWSPGSQAGGQAWTEGQPNADVPPAITTMPISLSVPAGTPATFSVVATGVPVPTYRWMRGGVVLLGETAANYTLASPLLTDDGAIFQVIVENRVASITSAPVTLTVTTPPPEIIKTNLGYLRAQVDAVNLRPVDTTQLYDVQGIVTTHVNLTGSANCLFYMQDNKGGIAVFVSGKPGTEVPPAGARVRVVGPLTHFNGLLELNLVAANAKHVVEVISTGNAQPAPVALDYAWPTTVTDLTATSPGVAAAEANEGRLVRVDNVLLDTANANFTSGSNVTVTDAANPANTFILRIDSRVTEIIGQPKPTGAVSLVGVLGQFDSADPRAGGYQLTVTHLADILTGAVPEPITASAVVTGESITLNWNGTAGATYSVLRGTNVVGTLEPIATGLTTPTFTEATAGRAAGFYRITSP